MVYLTACFSYTPHTPETTRHIKSANLSVRDDLHVHGILGEQSVNG